MKTELKKIEVGTRVKFSHSLSNGGMLTFIARVVKLQDEKAWVEMPARVRGIPFAPLGGKRYGLYKVKDLVLA